MPLRRMSESGNAFLWSPRRHRQGLRRPALKRPFYGPYFHVSEAKSWFGLPTCPRAFFAHNGAVPTGTAFGASTLGPMLRATVASRLHFIKAASGSTLNFSKNGRARALPRSGLRRVLRPGFIGLLEVLTALRLPLNASHWPFGPLVPRAPISALAGKVLRGVVTGRAPCFAMACLSVFTLFWVRASATGSAAGAGRVARWHRTPAAAKGQALDILPKLTCLPCGTHKLT